MWLKKTDAHAPSAVLEPGPVPDVELSQTLLTSMLSAEINIRRGNANQAIDQLLDAANESKDPRIASKTAYWALQNGLFDQAKQAAQLWLEILKDQPENEKTQARIILANALLELQHDDQALDLYLKAINTSDDDEIYKRVASEMARLKNNKGLVGYYQKIIKQASNTHGAFVGLAILSARLNDFEISKMAVDEALRLDNTDQDAALIKLSYLFEDQDATQINEFAQSFLSNNSRANLFRMEYARYLSGDGQAETAIKQFEKVAATDDDQFQEATLNIIALAMQEEDFKLADKKLVQLLDINPTEFRLVYYRCQVQRELGNYELASELCNEITFGQFYFQAQLELADIYTAQEQLEKALTHLDDIPVSGEEEQIRVYLRKQQLLYQEDLLERSLTVLNQGLGKYPDNTSLLYARGLILSELGKVSEHERDMRKLIELDPENPHVYNALGYTLADLTTRYDEALELINKAIELNPDDAYILDSLGWVHFKLNNFELAQTHLEQAFQLSEDAEIAAHLGELYWVIGEKSRAKSVWRKAKKRTPDNKVLNRTLERFL